MKFEISNNPLDTISADVAVLFVFEGKKTFIATNTFSSFDSAVKGELSKIAKAEKFSGKKGTSVVAHFPKITLPTKVLLVGLGEKDSLTPNSYRKAVAQIAKLHKDKIDSLSISLLSADFIDVDIATQAYLVAEGIGLATYTFAQYKSKNDDARDFATVIISVDKKSQKDVQEGIQKAELYLQANRLARDLVNEQPAIATPTFIAKIAQDLTKKSDVVTCKVFDKAELEKMGMNAFLGIARGADTAPKFVYLHYKPGGKNQSEAEKRKIALVGKGITFDSGGVNVKPDGYMTTMKQDMAGAAAVIGVFSVIDKIKPDCEVIGLAALTPNMISGKSIVPGDVVKAYNGKTIEVLHTDAEGRVTLADSLSYAVELGATEIIDLATLTGACMVALGVGIAGIMGNDENLIETLTVAGNETGEELWQLPLPEDYAEDNKSDVADISNLPASRWGGAITAGLFLQEFVEKTKWAHLDIAGPAFAERDFPLGPKGGTGFGTRMLLNYLLAQKK